MVLFATSVKQTNAIIRVAPSAGNSAQCTSLGLAISRTGQLLLVDFQFCSHQQFAENICHFYNSQKILPFLVVGAVHISLSIHKIYPRLQIIDPFLYSRRLPSLGTHHPSLLHGLLLNSLTRCGHIHQKHQKLVKPKTESVSRR